MQIQYMDFGCLEWAGCVFSLGLLPILLWSANKNGPVALDERGMTLKDGRRVEWDQITKVKATDVYVNATASRQGTYAGTRFSIEHGDGSVKFNTGRMVQGRELVSYILAHLPEGTLQS